MKNHDIHENKNLCPEFDGEKIKDICSYSKPYLKEMRENYSHVCTLLGFLFAAPENPDARHDNDTNSNGGTE